ncbi:unnamed protein product [Pieris macdunnoughi]|uniref:Uncharacterized protein n=1 Tax=Pieris macdunnoughi TaxID=345717 RepID=A0A821VG50_9NEOP|nr:unnamed protein product [Pieris macdunnoughi]
MRCNRSKMLLFHGVAEESKEDITAVFTEVSPLKDRLDEMEARNNLVSLRGCQAVSTLSLLMAPSTEHRVISMTELKANFLNSY